MSWRPCPDCGFTLPPEMFNRWAKSCADCLPVREAETRNKPLPPPETQQTEPTATWSLARYMSALRRTA